MNLKQKIEYLSQLKPSSKMNEESKCCVSAPFKEEVEPIYSVTRKVEYGVQDQSGYTPWPRVEIIEKDNYSRLEVGDWRMPLLPELTTERYIEIAKNNFPYDKEDLSKVITKLTLLLKTYRNEL